MIVREQIFGKGYNDKLPPEFIPKGYLADIKNGVISNDKIETRTGYSAVGNDTGNKAILGLCGITTSAGLKRLYSFHNDSGDTAIEIYDWTGSGNKTKIDDSLLTNVGEGVNCVAAENVLYAFDGGSVPAKITPGSPSTAAAVADGNFPAGKFAVWFHNFLFVAGVSASKSRLYWSDLGDSDDFTNGVTGSLDINPDDGDEITGLAVLKDELIIFKRNRIWSLTGFGTASFTVDDLNEKLTGFGTVSHRSIVNTGNDLYYMSHVGGEPEFRSLQRTRYGVIVEGGLISDDIKGTLSGLNEGRLGQTAGIFDGRKVRWSYPLSGSTTNNQNSILDTVTSGWTRDTGINASCFAEFDFSSESAIYFGEATADSLTYILDTSTNDNGSAIDFQVFTRRYGGDRPELKKKWKYLYITTEDTGDYDLTVESSPDGRSYDSLGTVNVKASETILPFTLPAVLGTTDIVKERLHFAKKRGYSLQLKFYNSSLDEPVVIRDWEILYKHRSLKNL